MFLWYVGSMVVVFAILIGCILVGGVCGWVGYSYGVEKNRRAFEVSRAAATLARRADLKHIKDLAAGYVATCRGPKHFAQLLSEDIDHVLSEEKE